MNAGWPASILALALCLGPAWSKTLEPDVAQPFETHIKAGRQHFAEAARDNASAPRQREFTEHQAGAASPKVARTPTWTEIIPIGVPPKIREAHSAIYDPVRDRMVVFGGWSFPDYLDDVWVLSLAGVPTWTAIAPVGTKPRARALHGAIYDPVRDRMVVFGGVGGQFFNDVWELSLAGTPTWRELAPTGLLPIWRYADGAIYDSARNRMIVFGGWDLFHALNDTWALSLGDTPAWRRLTPTGALPGLRYLHSAIYDPVGDRMIVFGGIGAGILNDVWALSLAEAPVWTPIAHTGILPRLRAEHTAIYDPVRERMVVFGGFDGTFRPDFLGDVLVLPLRGAPEWSSMMPVGTPPTARSGHKAVYDPIRDRMVVFGGDGGADRFNDVWTLEWADERAPDCGEARALLEPIWPPHHQLTAVTIAGVTDPDGDPVRIVATAITQDEAVNTTGDGNTCPDAMIDPDGAAHVRMERSARGNGRVYRVSFKASDPRGASCEGVVTVCVPHDQGAGDACVDDGPLYDSLGPCKRGSPKGGRDIVATSDLTVRSNGRKAVLEYALAEEAYVNLSVFDLSGRRVAVVDDGARSAGAHQVTWDTEAVRNGVYFYRLQVGGATVLGKVLVMK